MQKFLYAYHGGGAPETQEEGERVMKAWMDWMGSMGDALVDGGNPVGMSSTLTKDGLKDGGGANPLSGYTVVQAESLEAAAEMARGCPIFEADDASIEIAPIMEM